VPHIIRIPANHELPSGPRRRFVEELHRHYRAARRPALRVISDRIKDRDDLSGTASPETIRRMLRGATVPANWETVNAVLIVLCELAGRDSAGYAGYYVDESEALTYAESLEFAWNEALDNLPALPYSDEPPFDPRKGLASTARRSGAEHHSDGWRAVPASPFTT